MALMICPDCGKMVSDRAGACPGCGCPADYFKPESEIVQSSEIKAATGKEDDVRKVSDIEDDDDIIDGFFLLGMRIEYPQSAEVYIRVLKMHNRFAYEAECELRDKYKSVKVMDRVVREVIPAAIMEINKVVRENVELLYKNNIYISESEFKRKYDIDFPGMIKPMLEAYGETTEAAERKKLWREFERAGRSHWEGWELGGFGIKGAISGAVKAGAMNAVTGMGRAIGDTIVDGADETEAQNAKQKIYNDESLQKNFFRSMRVCIMNADIGLAETLAGRKKTDIILMSLDAAMEVFEAANLYEKNLIKKAQKCIEAIQLYPLITEFYKPVIQAVYLKGGDDINELMRLIKFWNMDGDYKSFVLQAEKGILVNKYFSAHKEAEKANFSDYSPSTYIKLKETRKELIHAVGNTELPEIVPFCRSLKSYFDNCLDKENCLSSIEIIKAADDEVPIEDFIHRIHNEKSVLPGLLKEIWVKGDSDDIPEARIKNKWQLPMEDIIYMYQNKAVFGTMFGGKGFVLTNSLLCDLNSGSIIGLGLSVNIKYEVKDSTVRVSNGKEEIIIDLSTERPAARRFMYVCLEAFIADYCKVPEKKIFCPYCGNQIPHKVKFCNFCGKMNRYGMKEEIGL